MADYEDDDQVVVVEKGGAVSAFLWGTLIGAAATLLFAPRSGVETRRELGLSFRRLRDTADATLRDIQETIDGSVRDVRGKVESHVDEARSAFDAGRHAARGARSDLSRRWEEGRDGVRSAYRPRSAAPAPESEEE